MSMTPNEIRAAIAASPELTELAKVRNDGEIARLLSAKLPPKVISLRITERGVRTLDGTSTALGVVQPRHRFALLSVLRDAAVTQPAWLVPTLTAVGVPVEDHAAFADDLASAQRWLLDSDGLDVGAKGARSMLDLIAAAVPLTRPACAAVKALAERPDSVLVEAVSAALNEVV